MKEPSMEVVREVWDNESPEHWEVGPDRDGLGCVEIRFKDEAGKIVERMMFPPAIAAMIADAIGACAIELTKKPSGV